MISGPITSKPVREILILTIFIPLLVYSQNLLNGPNDIVFDAVNNRYLVSNWAGNSIVEIDLIGNQSYFKNNITNAHGMEVIDSMLCVASYHNIILMKLSTAEIVHNIYIPGSNYLGHVTWDSLHYVYVTDWSSKRLFRVNISNQTSTILHSFGGIPVGIYHEENNNRLIILTLVNNAPILEYNLANGILNTIRNTTINDPDAICRDAEGNYYITSFSENTVYKFSQDFSAGPEIISTGHGGPSGIGYNIQDDILGVTNYNFNSIDLIQLPPINIEYKKEMELKQNLLIQNYPNPFNPTTTIEYYLAEPGYVQIKVYNLLGEEIESLVNKYQSAGKHQIIFDGMDCPSGFYYYELKYSNQTLKKSMLLLR